MDYNCDICSFHGKDNYALNRHLATSIHAKNCLERGEISKPIDITMLSPPEELEYIKNHHYYTDQYRSANMYRIQLNEEEIELRGQLGYVWDKFKGWVQNGDCLTDQEIEDLVEKRYPYEDKNDTNSEERFNYRKILEGSRSLSFEEKQAIRDRLDTILDAQKKNYDTYMNAKLLDQYKKQARAKLINEYNQYVVQAKKRAERDALKKKQLEAKLKYLEAMG